nr:group II intron reverse transcriptase/maturase [Frankia sp. Cj3]
MTATRISPSEPPQTYIAVPLSFGSFDHKIMLSVLAASFLGYEITVQHSKTRPVVNGKIGLRVPLKVIREKCAPYLKHGKPERRPELLNLDDPLIIGTYGAEYRGIVQYHLLAGDVWRLDRLEWSALTSMLKTLAAKYGSTVTKMARKYKATIDTPAGKRTCFQAGCEWCQQQAEVEVHQVPSLADLARTGRPARVGATHGSHAQEDPRGLPLLPPRHPHGQPKQDHDVGRWRATCSETGPRGSDRESTEKDSPPGGTSPPAYRCEPLNLG